LPQKRAPMRSGQSRQVDAWACYPMRQHHLRNRVRII
jgi:hypothetical protein